MERINEAKKSKAAAKDKKRELIASVKNKLPSDEGTREVDDRVDGMDGQWRMDILQGRKRSPKCKVPGNDPL